MKHVYSFLVFVFIYASSNAQIKEDDILLGGNLGIYSDVTNSSQTGVPSLTFATKTNTFNINPSLGRAIKDNLVLGIDVTYRHYTFSDSGAASTPTKETTNGFAGGVFIRRYKPIGLGFSLFGQAELGGNYSHTHDINYPATNQILDHTDQYGFTLQLYPGIAYAVNRNWQVEMGLPNFLSLSYMHYKNIQEYTNSPTSTTNEHSVNFSNNLIGSDEFSVGVRYIIAGK